MSKRRLLFEAGPLLDIQKSGVGYYTGHLINALSDLYGNKLELTGYYFNFLNRHGDKVPPTNRLQLYKIWLIPGKLLSVCRRLGFQPYLEFFVHKKSDVVLFTNYVVLPALRKRKIALVVYDLGFLDAPEYVQTINLRYLKRFCPPSIRQADTIITISDFTKQRLEYHFPDVKAEIVVTPIPPAADAKETRPLNSRLFELGIHKKSYILYVGTLEPRKNIETLMQAYSRLDPKIRDMYSLVLAGGKGWKDSSILNRVNRFKAEGLSIIQPGYVSEEEKSSLYSQSACFVLPSHYEGFGMPILEAMQHGTPTAVSDIPVFHEVAGNAAVYFDKDDPADIAEKIGQLLSDKNLIDLLNVRASVQLEKFSWQENANKVYEALS